MIAIICQHAQSNQVAEVDDIKYDCTEAVLNDQ